MAFKRTCPWSFTIVLRGGPCPSRHREEAPPPFCLAPCGGAFFGAERSNCARKGLCHAPRLLEAAPLDKVIRQFVCTAHWLEPRLPV